MELTESQRQAIECAQKFCVASGKPGTGKTETLLERSLTLSEKFGADKVLVIAPQAVSVQNIIMRLKKSGSVSLPAVSDIFSFACEVAGDEYQRARSISDFGTFLILRAISRSIPFRSRLKEFMYLPGFVESLSQIVTKMRQAGISSESLRMHSGSDSDILRDLALVLDEYERVLSEKKLTDRQQIIDSARELVEKGKVTLPRHILVDDLQDFSPVEMSLINALSKRCETAFFAADTYEAGSAGSQIFSALFLGKPPKSFAFDKRFGAFASFPENQTAVETRFFTDAVSESLWVADKITELKNKPESADSSLIVIAQEVNSLLLLADEFDRRGIVFYTLPHHLVSRDACARATLSLLGALTEVPQRHLLELLRLPKTSVSDEVLAGLKESFDKEEPLKLLRSISEGAQVSQKLLDVSLTARESARVRTLISLIDILTTKKDSLKLREVVDSASKLTLKVNPLLEEFADEFDFHFESETPISSLHEVVSQSLTFWAGLDVREPGLTRFGSGEPANLQILLPSEVSCAEADFLFMPGLQEGAFTTPRVSLLAPEEESAIEGAASGALESSTAQEREYLFERCASCAKRKLFLSCHRSEAEREFLPSRFLRAVAPDYASKEVQAFLGFGRALEVKLALGGQADKPLTLARDFTLSASSINDYLACPRMFYFAHILGIPEPFVSPNMVIGGIMHAVMKELRQPGSRGVPPGIEKAKEILQRELSSRSRDFRTDAELEGARRRCEHLLSEYLQLEDDWRSQVHAAEKEFRWKFGDFLITGRMDRIDKTESGFEIVDYKLTGNKKGRGLKNKFLVKKEDFQLPVYYWAAREALGLDISAFSYVYFDFNKTGRPEKVTLRFCEEGKADEVILFSQIENAKERLAEIIEEIFTACVDFPVGEEAPCTGYVMGCPYRSICVKAQH